MKSKITIGIAGLLTAIALMPLLSAFEAHVVNVTARIENALFVHPESLEYGTVFPQEHLFTSFGVMASQSFSSTDQRRVGIIEYVIKQKPKPRPALVLQLGKEGARDWCHQNAPADANDPNDPYYINCYPSMCPYLSKTEVTPENPENDHGLPPFHNPDLVHASGTIIKFKNGSTINNDPIDQWELDLAVPCFKGMCAQDWDAFVLGLNPHAGDPKQYQLPPGLEHQVFGCDIWVEVTNIR